MTSGSNQIGKRYTCERCATRLICVKAGAGQVTCHGERMMLIAPKPLPSTD